MAIYYVAYLSWYCLQNRSSVDRGLDDAAKVLRAPITIMTVDQKDVERVSSRASSDIERALAVDNSSQWEDGGFYLLPFLALCALGWFRKGWSL